MTVTVRGKYWGDHKVGQRDILCVNCNRVLHDHIMQREVDAGEHEGHILVTKDDRDTISIIVR